MARIAAWRYRKPLRLARRQPGENQRPVAPPSALAVVPAHDAELWSPPAPPGAEEVLALWTRGATPNTATARLADLKLFARQLGTTSIGAVERLLRGPRGEAVRLALYWAQDMTEAKLKPATIARRMSTLRGLVSFARLLGVVEWHLDAPSPHVESYTDTRGPELDDVKRLLEERYSGYGPMGARNRCIIVLIATLGLRRAEVCALKLEDYDKSGHRLLVHGKGNRIVWVTLPQFTCAALDAYLAMRDQFRIESEYLLLGKGSARLNPDPIRSMLVKVGELAGVHVRPHGLRHAAVTIGLDSTNGDVRATQQFARHRDPKTTLRYDDNRRDLAGSVARLVAEKLSGKGET